MHTLLALATALVFGSSVFGQDVLFVEKQQHFIQLNGTPSTVPAGFNIPMGVAPFKVEYAVEISGVTSASFTPPAGSTYGGGTNLTPDDGDFTAILLFGAKTNPNNIDGMDNRIKNGTHTISLDGGATTISLDLSVDAYPSAAPTIAVAGTGTWIGGGVYQIGAGQAFTLTSSAFANWNTGLLNHTGLYVSGQSGELGEASTFSNDTYFGDQDNTDHSYLEFTSGLAAGTYFVEADYNAVVDIESSIAGYPGAFGLAMYTMRTQFQIQVIPEPSTYAAIFGVLTLAAAAFRRRKIA